jgi:hypothetical protein
VRIAVIVISWSGEVDCCALAPVVWDNVYGFDYSCMKEIALREPLVDTVETKSVVSKPCVIKVRDQLSCAFNPSHLTQQID